VKIAIVRKKYVFHGGSEGFSRELIAQLAGRGNEVHVFALQWEGSRTPANVTFHRVPAISFNSFLRDLSFALSAYRLLKKEPFDIIQSHDKTLFQHIYRAGDGCHIEWLQQRWKRTGLSGKISIVLNPYHWLILSLERLILRGHRFRKVIAISHLVKKNIIQHYGVQENDIEVIYNGVDLEKFNPANREQYRKEIRNWYSLPDDAFVVLFVGSGFERKGIEFLLKAMELVPYPLTALIVGKGPEKNYRQFIKRQKVIFCGPQPEIRKYYAASDIFVFPAIYEPFGNVHLEALASGLPVITTGLSGAAEIIRDGVHGFVVPMPDDYPHIAEKIQYFMDNRKAYESMCINARQRAEEFSFQKHLNETLRLYREILDKVD
jgi:UDP-glucose:(heptosyl)LPS alpha-1,3-glucosyltransferase